MTLSGDRVLIVDDDKVVRLLIRTALKRYGMVVEEAADGETLVECFHRFRPDIILLDAVMPGVNGFDACTQLRRAAGGQHVPVVMLTGLADEDSIERAYECGATDFFIKSPQVGLLAHRMRYVLRTSRMRAELVRSREMLTKAQRIARLGSWQWNFAERIVHASDETCHLLGLTCDEFGVPESEFVERLWPDGVEAFRTMALTATRDSAVFQRELVVASDPGIRLVNLEAQLECDGAGRAASLNGTLQDITERRRSEEEVRRLANYDTLTGLANRNLFGQKFSEALAEAIKTGEKLALLFIDLDRFKNVNDTLGHAAGDKLLREVTVRINRSVRSRDAVARAGEDIPQSEIARLGGDEFTVLLRDIHGEKDAVIVAERIIAALRNPFTIDGTECWIGASVGVALYPDHGLSAELLMAHADAAMYEAKEAGRDACRVYAESAAQPTLQSMRFEADLRRALERNELVLHWQPVYDIVAGRITGAEVLMRWQRDGRIVMPGEFIPVAESTGLILPMGEWALTEACSQLRRWQDAGLSPLYVAVNMNSAHMRKTDIADQVHAALRASDLPSTMLQIEITETGMMDFSGPALQGLHALRESGVRIAIDDFGTGYSSLAYLKKLPVTTLKIDRSFVADLGVDSDDEAIVAAISGLARALSLDVVAEGVETPMQHQWLEKHGVTAMQGYLFGRPMPAHEFELLLRGQVSRVRERRGKPERRSRRKGDAVTGY